jgi:hypothetical protein
MKRFAAIALLAWAMSPMPGLAQKSVGVEIGEDIPPDILTDGFLEAHPDLMYRKAGLRADDRHDPVSARHQYPRIGEVTVGRPEQVERGMPASTTQTPEEH